MGIVDLLILLFYFTNPSKTGGFTLFVPPMMWFCIIMIVAVLCLSYAAATVVAHPGALSFVMGIHIHHFHMWNWNLQVTVPKWGFRHPHFHTGMDQSLTHSRILSFSIWGSTEKANVNTQMGMVSIWGSPFPYRDLHMETGRQTKKLPFGESPFQNTIRDHMGINIYIKDFINCTKL